MTTTAVRLSWFGHATVLIEDGARILTDPVLGAGVAHLHRRAGPVPGEAARRVDAVVVSHLHSDHLHLPSLRLVAPGTPVLVPRGGAGLLARLPLEPVEVAVGDVVPVGDAVVTVVPAVHDGRRWPWSRTRAAALGYVVRGRGTTYFAGDTAFFPGMASVADELDAALLPVGGWGPWLRGDHLDAREAASCLPVLDPAVAVPIHYGTLWPRGLARIRPRAFHDPGHDFVTAARRLAPEVDVRVLAHGASTEVAVGAR